MRFRAACFSATLFAFAACASLAASDTFPPAPTVTMKPPSPLREGEIEPDRIALGAKLFSDPRLSRDGTMSCASCHDPKQAFTNPKPPVRPGITDERLRRDVPSLLNVADASPLHHDGPEPSLEVQILSPLFNKAEMANTTFDDLTNRLAAIPEYRAAFASVFRSAPTIENLGAALAAFERSLVSGNSAFDMWRQREQPSVASALQDSELTEGAQSGYALFTGKAGCADCHVPGKFTTNAFLNTGIGFQSEARRVAVHPEAPTDRGREEVTHKREDRYKFRMPTLRNVELTAPYMHDGSLKSLEDVVAYYDKGGSSDPEKDARIKRLGLRDAEKQALLAFLKSLTSIELTGAPQR